VSAQPSNPEELARDVPSPCVDVCRMNDATGVCEGCFRTIDEIANWSVMSASGKRMVLARIKERRLY
jgi:predicted Fe-S protein YdhL (DUF1289 family)